MPAKRQRRTRLLLAGLAAAAGLVAAESVARATYRPTLELGEVVEWERKGFTPRPDALGFREAPVPREAFAEEATRVLFLGDSFTFGYGVDDGSLRFSDVIERDFAESSPTGGLVHIYNAGVSGTYPTHWIGYLRELLPVYRPEHVVAVFFLRDGTLLGTSLRFNEAKIEEIRERHTGGPLYEMSYLARTFLDRRVARDFTQWYLGEFERSYLGDEEQTSTWRDMQVVLGRMDRLCKREGIDFSLVIFPMLFDLDDYRFEAVEREIERFCDESGIRHFSLTPGFLGREASELWVSQDDQHPNAAGHALAAATLRPYLEDVLKRCPACRDPGAGAAHRLDGTAR